MKNKFGRLSAVIILALLGLCRTAAAEEDVGKVVAVRGKGTIERGSSRLNASVKGGILVNDVVRTAADSRAKLLFIDDSVLTLSDNSRLVIKEFIQNKGDRGKSIFNLLDGKMRSVVGKTRFEVQTPTAVAAARGTVIFFDVSRTNNVTSSKIICLEGHVQIRSTSPAVQGAVTLSPGRMVVVSTGQTALPKPVAAPPAELQKARAATSSAGLSEEKGQGDKSQQGEQGQGQGDKGSQSDKDQGDKGQKSGTGQGQGEQGSQQSAQGQGEQGSQGGPAQSAQQGGTSAADNPGAAGSTGGSESSPASSTTASSTASPAASPIESAAASTAASTATSPTTSPTTSPAPSQTLAMAVASSPAPAPSLPPIAAAALPPPPPPPPPAPPIIIAPPPPPPPPPPSPTRVNIRVNIPPIPAP